MSARTPTAFAMDALTLDHLSGGRVILGMGVSGPQVVEGWYGQPFSKPLARTREVVDIVRQVLAREAPVTNDGPHYPLPFTGEGTTGLGKPLKPITHPLRADIPIWLGAEGPKNVAQTAEIGDGWMPIFYTPRLAGMYNEWLDEGFARPGARRTREDFEICATAQVVITDDRSAAFAGMKPFLALYMGGMGAKDTNFHATSIAGWATPRWSTRSPRCSAATVRRGRGGHPGRTRRRRGDRRRHRLRAQADHRLGGRRRDDDGGHRPDAEQVRELATLV